MSLPSELRVLCFQLSSIPIADLPRHTPTLLRLVSRCEVPLATPENKAAKGDASATSVLVHKLKTQLSTLLNGKSSEGRFSAVVLIKGVVEVGGWEVLRSTEPWVRGILSLLGKSEPNTTKELAVIVLTKIYYMTHQYQTLVREITTPTLPTFVTSCLNLLSSRTALPIPISLRETIFRSFSMLIPRHTTIYRPFATQIRIATRPYLAPTMSDRGFMPNSLKQSARRLVVVLHQTVAKNAGGEEWSKAVRDLVKDIHRTADLVFRAVIEDWESTVSYVGESVDVNKPLGASKTAEDLSRTGIHSGVERLVGLLEMLSEYFRGESSSPVTIPLDAIVDMVNRMLSISISSPSDSSQGSTRLHPAIDRDERDGLWSGLPQIYIAALQLIDTLAVRLEDAFLSTAQGILDQMIWIFSFGKHSPEFRLVVYNVAAKILHRTGQGLDRSRCGRLSPIIRACCGDLHPVGLNFNGVGVVDGARKKSLGNGTNSHHNADSLLSATVGISMETLPPNTELVAAANELLPLFLSHLPQHYMDASLRPLTERTAVLIHNKNAMLASIINPFVGRNGKALSSILPHLTREFAHDDVVEILLRPRMPLLPNAQVHNASVNGEEEEEVMDFHVEPSSSRRDIYPATSDQPRPDDSPKQLSAGQTNSPFTSGLPSMEVDTVQEPNREAFDTGDYLQPVPDPRDSILSTVDHSPPTLTQHDTRMSSAQDSSDDESVHLTMQLDSDSESE